MTPEHVPTSSVPRPPVLLGSDGPTVTATVTGDLDSIVAATLRAVVRRCLRDRDVATLVVDLGDVSTFGSAGLRVLTRLRSSCRRRGVDFEIHHPSATTARVLEMYGFAEQIVAVSIH